MLLIYLYHSDLKSDMRKVTCSLNQMALASCFDVRTAFVITVLPVFIPCQV